MSNTIVAISGRQSTPPMMTRTKSINDLTSRGSGNSRVLVMRIPGRVSAIEHVVTKSRHSLGIGNDQDVGKSCGITPDGRSRTGRQRRADDCPKYTMCLAKRFHAIRPQVSSRRAALGRTVGRFVTDGYRTDPEAGMRRIVIVEDVGPVHCRRK